MTDAPRIGTLERMCLQKIRDAPGITTRELLTDRWLSEFMTASVRRSLRQLERKRLTERGYRIPGTGCQWWPRLGHDTT